MFNLSHFFGTQVAFGDSTPVASVTVCLLPEKTENGVSIVPKCLEQLCDERQGLDFRDFQINNLLAAGIPLKSIKLSKDCRIGSDKEIAAFNARVDELSDKMFNL